MKKSKFIISGIFALLFISCYNNTPEPEELNSFENNGAESVFACGYTFPVQEGHEYGYWLNGNWIPIENQDSSCTYTKRPMIDNDGNVYIQGHIDRDDTTVYGYWKNGKWTPLEISSDYQIQNMDIDKKGKICLLFKDSEEQYGYILKDEKNNTLQKIYLTQRKKDQGAQIITNPVFDNLGNVYFGGCYKDENSFVNPCYWKNGTFFPVEKWRYAPYDIHLGYVSSIIFDNKNRMHLLQCIETTGTNHSYSYYICSNYTDSTTNDETDWHHLIVHFVSFNPDFFYQKGDSVYFLGRATTTTNTICYGYLDEESYKFKEFDLDYNYFNAACATPSGEVLLAGHKKAADFSYAGYMHNDNWTYLVNPYHDGWETYCYGITATDKNICAFGKVYYGYKNACYWKDGKYYELKNPYDTKLNSTTTSIISDSNGSIYIGGTVFNGEKYVAGFWKDTVWQYVSEVDEERDIQIYYNKVNDEIISFTPVFIYSGFGSKQKQIGYYPRNFYGPKEVVPGGLGIDANGEIYISERNTKTKENGYRRISTDEFTKIDANYSSPCNKFYFHDSDIYIYNDYYYEYWKNGECISIVEQYPDIDCISRLMFDKDNIMIIAGDSLNNKYYAPYYLVGDTITYCKSPKENIDCYISDFCINSSGDHFVAGNAYYSNYFANEKIVPGIWTNGEWSALPNPYEHPYGKVVSILVCK